MPTDHATTYALVKRHLRDLRVPFDELNDDVIQVPAGTSAVAITVEDLEGRSIVLLSAEVVADVDPTDDVRDGLLRANAGLRFGKFAWLADDRVITVDYELLGDTLDRDELGFSLERVREIADHADNRLLTTLGHGRLPHQ